MTMKKLLMIGAVCSMLFIPLVPAGQDFSGANQSNDPCYKIKQMKKFIMESADYRKTFGSRDPAYIQCYPLTISVLWNLTDTEHTNTGTDEIAITLEEQYPASLMLHYGWFDGLQKKKLEKYEIWGPEPCDAPCPGRVATELMVMGEIVCCLDSPYCRKKQKFYLTNEMFIAMPTDAESQYAHLRFQGGPGEQSEGKVNSSRLAINKTAVPKGFCRGDPFNYKLEFGPMGADFPAQRIMHCQGAPTAEEIMEGLRVGELKKVYKFSAQDTASSPPGLVYAHTLQGTATVTIAFVPFVEERWRVTVDGWQEDKSNPPIQYQDKDGIKKALPIWVEIGHSLIGEFVVRKSKSVWTYKSGSVTKYTGWSKLFFTGTDLYKCETVPCPGLESEGPYNGRPIDGQVTDHSVQLKWPQPGDWAKACVFCKPLKSFLKKIPYRLEFGGESLVTLISKEVLPLTNGYTRTGKAQDWLKYKITLTKIK